jgi:hypothetical protein
MRNLFLIVIILFNYVLFAQGNLQFNQALLFSGQTLNTVPAGKIWKVKNTAQSYNSSGSALYTSLVINRQSWFPQGSGGSLPSGPIWLPAGSTISGYTAYTQFNIIEFNIIP